MINLKRPFDYYEKMNGKNVRKLFLNIIQKQYNIDDLCINDINNINYCLVLMQEKNSSISNNIMKLINDKENNYKNKICEILTEHSIIKIIEEKMAMLKKSINLICDFNAVFEKLEN